MHLTISGELAKQLFLRAKKDEKIAYELASELASSIDSETLAQYLLSPDVAIFLLNERFNEDPEGTFASLQSLPGGARVFRRQGKLDGRSTSPRTGRPPGKASKKRSVATRKRLTAEDLEELKEEVRAFLKKNPWSTRKDLTSHVALSTQAIYRRVMVEMQNDHEVISQGEKSKAIYALKGTPKSGVKKKRASR